MNTKLISVGAGMFGLGALFGWAVTADHYDQKLKQLSDRQDLLEERVELLRKRATAAYTAQSEDGIKYRRRIQELEERFSEQLETEEEGDRERGATVTTGEEISASDSEGVEEYSEEKTEAIRQNLQSVIDSYTGDPDAINAFVDVGTKAVQNNTPPFVISKEKFAWDEEEGDDYSKITLTYFPRHRMLLDDEEDPIEDVANTVGWKNLNQFGGESGDPEVVFVRNRKLMTDFEVVRDTENELPTHVKYGMGREEFLTNKAAGVIKLRPEDRD